MMETVVLAVFALIGTAAGYVIGLAIIRWFR